VSYLSCPRCGLTVRVRQPFLVMERCPRCIARSRQIVVMEPSEAPVRAKSKSGLPGLGGSRASSSVGAD
jgi:hypothetical protein